MDLYIQSHRTGMGCHPKYIMEIEGVEIENLKESLLCSVKYTNANKINRLLTETQELSGAPPDSLLDVLEELGRCA